MVDWNCCRKLFGLFVSKIDDLIYMGCVTKKKCVVCVEYLEKCRQKNEEYSYSREIFEINQ